MSNTDPESELPPEEGVSLDELAQAFAQVMGIAPRSGGPVARPAAQAEAVDSPAAQPSEPQTAAADEGSHAALPAEEDDSCPVSPQTIFEAMLFVGDRENRPLSAAAAAQLMRGVEPGEVHALVQDLNRRYLANGCPYEILSEREGYRLTLRNAFSSLSDRFHGRLREARLSQAAIDVLAIVAYQQPMVAEQVSTLRGKPSSHVLAQLVHRGLLRIERKPGTRKAQYFTTERFLRLFGMQTLADLPQSEELGGKE